VVEGKVERTAAASDAATRTLQIEISLPNREGALLPGAYVQASLPLAASHDLVIPTNALIFGSQGVQVASVEGDGRVKLRGVKVGRNFGSTVEVLEGLKGGEQLVLNPPDSMADGDKVTVVPNEKG
jgi:RND family efflux transporter MFP subunit